MTSLNRIHQEETMEREKTIEILKALAEGIDPGTGEQFPAGSTYQHPDTVRALFAAIRGLENPTPRPAKTDAPQKPAPENAGRPWSQEEDSRLGQIRRRTGPNAQEKQMGDRIQAGAHGQDPRSAALRAAFFAGKCRDERDGVTK